ncbi:MAG: M24 family metallopeptidase [Patescibacteria group bacterium]|jgi:Xaa-Pro aminopeptidase
MDHWQENEFESHQKAAKALDMIMAEAFDFIQENENSVSEYDVQQNIMKGFRRAGLVSDNEPPIVAFGPNTRHVHYFPGQDSRVLQENDLIMIDIWASFPGQNPYADITWMGYRGTEIDPEIKLKTDLVFEARDQAIKYLKSSLDKNIIPTGEEIDRVARDYFGEYEANFFHTLGHSLGFDSPHGRHGRLGAGNIDPLLQNVGYTIEPGLYFDLFGARSEIDFIITEKKKMIITTKVQSKIVVIK